MSRYPIILQTGLRKFLSVTVCLLFSAVTLQAQNYDALVNNLDSEDPVLKLKSLNKLAIYFEEVNIRKAVDYGKQATAFADTVYALQQSYMDQNYRYGKVIAYSQMGSLYTRERKFKNARKYLQGALTEAIRLGSEPYKFTARLKLQELDSISSNNESLDLVVTTDLSDITERNSAGAGVAERVRNAYAAEKAGRLEEALNRYRQIYSDLLKYEDNRNAIIIQRKIAEIYINLDQPDKGIAFYQMALGNATQENDKQAQKEINQVLSKVFGNLSKPVPIIFSPKTDSSKSLAETSLELRELSRNFEDNMDYNKSLIYMKQYAELQSRLIKEQQENIADSIALVNQAQEIRLLEQENKLNELRLNRKNQEINRQAKFRDGLGAGLVVLLLLTTVFYRLFISKKKAHHELEITYNNLEQARIQLSLAQSKIEKLLGQQVSAQVAAALLSEDEDNTVYERFVCVMFLDIRDFTPFASSHTPKEVLDFQNDIFGFMIEIIDKHKGVINQFMGDGFMATFGISSTDENHCLNAFNACLEILREMGKYNRNRGGEPTRLGIGLHAGNVVSGNVGTELRKQYCITGTPVITAARIEQLNKKYKSQLLISSTVARQVASVHDITGRISYRVRLKGLQKVIRIFKIA